MTERQDLRPLSTEDLLPDERNRTEESRHSDRAEEGADEGRAYPAQQADNRTDEARRLDEDRAVGSDQHDKTRTGGDQYDEALAQDNASSTVERDNDTTATPVAQDGGDESAQQQRPSTDDDDHSEPLFSIEEVDRFRVEWRELQSDFVDHPRDAVQHADELVAQVMQSLATTFADHKRSLEGQWSAGEQVETEELRVALRRYRAFFDQLLTV